MNNQSNDFSISTWQHEKKITKVLTYYWLLFLFEDFTNEIEENAIFDHDS